MPKLHFKELYKSGSRRVLRTALASKRHWKLMPGYNLIYLLGGFAVYVAGTLSMILAYRYGELSVLQPINSMSYVFSTILAVLKLHEKIPAINIAGIVFIVSGVIVIGVNSRSNI